MIRTGRLAIDLGAGSGRALVGAFSADRLALHEVHRFHYSPRPLDGHLRWDAARLFSGLQTSVAEAAAYADTHHLRLDSVGVDSWAIDYGLVDDRFRLLEEPICYRDERTVGVPTAVFARVPRDEIYARTGIQFLALNTLYQLVAHCQEGLPDGTARLLLIPDLCHHFLCGATASERTNASTTQLLSAASGTWDAELFARLGLPLAIMPDLVEAGTELGVVRKDLVPGHRALADRPRVVAPATHDTASAVAGTAIEPGWAFLSSGTWSLLGVERDAPQLDAAAARANFTNEAGVAGTVRFLTNVMGLWLLESCRKEWTAAGRADDLPALLAAVAAVPGFAGFINPDDPRFFAPASMTREVRASLAETGQATPDDPVRLAKVVLDSLAARYAVVVSEIARLTGRPVHGVHIVGGGSLNTYLNQATANATGRPVVAGPVEATAIGNLVVQAMGRGELASLADARHRVRGAVKTQRFEPRDEEQWREGHRRFQDVTG